MKMAFSHRGRQFFFVTLTLEGRPAVLSRLVDAASEPALLPPGEIALAILRAIHSVCSCATLSNRVIMPDHVHFLLIVNYDLAPTFNPLWFSFVLVEAIEAAWAAAEKASGANWAASAGFASNGRGHAPAPPTSDSPAPSWWLAESPEAILAATVARARARAAAYQRDLAAFERGREIAGGGEAAGAATGAAGERGRGGATPVRSPSNPASPSAPLALSLPPSPASLRFDRRVYIELSFDSRQLKAVRRYIRLNGARAIWKRDHPDRFRCFANIRHAVLDPMRHWSAIGNLTLLASPFLFHVRLTLKKTVVEHEAAIGEIVERARRGEIPVSGFISPGEVEALRRLKAEPLARFVKALPCALPPRYDPSAEDSRELAADRMLLLSGFRDTPAISSLSMRRDAAAAHQFRCNCLALNDLIADLCHRAQTLSP